MPAASSTRTRTRSPADCTASASRSSTRSPSASSSRSGATGTVYFQRYHRGQPEVAAGRDRHDAEARHQGHLQARSADLPSRPSSASTSSRSACASWRSSTAACASRSRTSAPRREHEFHYKGGIVSFVEHLELDQDADPRGGRSTSTASATASTIEVAMQWNDGYTETIYTFANNINTDRGRHAPLGFRRRSRARSTPTPSAAAC